MNNLNDRYNQMTEEKLSRRRLKAITAGSLANLLVWFDWYIYASFSIYFSASFFPNVNQTVQLLQTAGIFALGFLMRPIGGWFLGTLADRFGRRKSMLLSVFLMSFGSFLIAITPTYATIGVYAPIILLLARLIQGLSIGGGTGITTAYLSEMSPPQRRGYFASFQYTTLVGGQILALGLLIILQRFFLTESQLYDWGWRIPFFIGTAFSFGIIYLQDYLQETKAFEAANTEKRKSAVVIWRQLIQYPKAIIMVVGLTLGGTLAFYTAIVYMQKYLINTGGISKEDATLVTFAGLLVFALAQPVFGAISDKIGRRPLLISFGILGVLTTVPVLSTIGNSSSILGIFGMLSLYLLIISMYSSISVVVKAELFPAEVRVIGIGLPHAITVAVFGGSAEYIALWLKNIGHEMWFFGYVTLGILLSLICFLFMDDTRTINRMNEEPNG